LPKFRKFRRELEHGIFSDALFCALSFCARGAPKFFRSLNLLGRFPPRFSLFVVFFSAGQFQSFRSAFNRQRQKKTRNSSARILQKFCVLSTLHSRFFFCVRRHCRLGKQLQRSSEVCVTHTGRLHADFVRAARRNSRNSAILSRDLGAKLCVISTPTARFFDGNALVIFLRASKMSLDFSLRMLSARNFCARGAPKFFGNFAILSRDFGAQCA